jgi:hypothetical protein
LVLARFANGPKLAFYKRYRSEADLYTINANGTGVKRTSLWADAHEHGVAFWKGPKCEGRVSKDWLACPYSPKYLEKMRILGSSRLQAPPRYVVCARR